MTTGQQQAGPGRTVSTDVFPIEENFRTRDKKDLKRDWSLKGEAKLTGDDGLQLTPKEQFKAGTALLNAPFPSTAGVSIEFDYYAAGGAGDHTGDGFTVYLIDGAYDTDVGGTGAGLGYSRGPDGKHDGVTKGYLGIGFDSAGYFSSDSSGPGGPGIRANNVVLRGPGDKKTGFNYIKGVEVADGLSAKWEDKARVQVIIINGAVTVNLTRNDKTTTVLNRERVTKPEQMPGTFKLGLSASTGGYPADWHCVRNLVVAMPAEMPLRVGGSAEVPAGSTVSFTITVRNDGPNDVSAAELTGTLKPGLSNVSVTVAKTEGGATAGQSSTTAATFTQPLTLPINGSATITVTGTTDRAATGTVTCTATIESKKNRNTAKDKSASHTTRLTAHVPQDNLKVCQQTAVSVESGHEGHLAITVENPDRKTVDLKNAELVFDAPSGFEWTGSITYGYYKGGKSIGSDTKLAPEKPENGSWPNRRLQLKGLQEFKPDFVLTYILGIKAKSGAKAGLYTDGQALVADSVPLRLTATVTDKEEKVDNGDSKKPVMQSQIPGVAPKDVSGVGVTVLFKPDKVEDLYGTFLAPTGFKWLYIPDMGITPTYSYHNSSGTETKGSKGDITCEITNDGKTLTIKSMPKLDLKDMAKEFYFTYVLIITAVEDAKMGRYDDGEAKIGNASPLKLRATVLAASPCNRK